MRKYISYLKYKFKEELNYFNLYKKKSGVGFTEYYRLKLQNRKDNISLFGRKLKVPDAFWHLHSLNEIFIEETYKFRTDNPNPLIIDCGSNVGLSIIYFKKNYPNASVIGFEPDPDIFKMLQSNLAQFAFSNIQLINKAVWIKDGELTFNAVGALGGTLDLAKNDNESLKDKVVVKTIRLKDFLKNNKVDFLKIDVEGAEFAILEDCLPELNNVENIFIEYHRIRGDKNLLGGFITNLEESGFRVYVKEAWNNLPNPYCYKDFKPMYDLQLNIFGYRS